jgi:uncharacterized protein
MSSSPTFDAFRLARKQELLRGEATMDELPRLAQSVLDPHARLHYEVVGRVDDAGHPCALMRLSARLPLRCERCNHTLHFALEREAVFRFFADEQELNALPIEDVEREDVVGSAHMKLLPWIEDEAILSLPLVPRHEDCAIPLEGDEPPGATARQNPFAALAKLKGETNGGSANG